MSRWHTVRARIASDRIAVEFGQLGDRLGHAIAVRGDATDPWTTILSSLEGDADDLWPPSPALQEVHLEERPAGAVALLVGRAGTSHWSASFAFDASGRLLVDVACRASSPPVNLGSSYELSRAADADWALIPQPPALLKSSQDSVVTVLPGWSIGALPATVRWQFAIETRRHEEMQNEE